MLSLPQAPQIGALATTDRPTTSPIAKDLICKHLKHEDKYQQMLEAGRKYSRNCNTYNGCALQAYFYPHNNLHLRVGEAFVEARQHLDRVLRPVQVCNDEEDAALWRRNLQVQPSRRPTHQMRETEQHVVVVVVVSGKADAYTLYIRAGPARKPANHSRQSSLETNVDSQQGAFQAYLYFISQ